MAEPVNTAAAVETPAAVGPESSHRDTKPTSLTHTIPRLRWILFKRSFRKNWGLIIGTAFGVLYGVGGLVFLGSLLIGSLFTPEDVGGFPVVVRALGIFLLLAWTLIPILSFGLDDTLGPRKFAAFGRSPRELLKPVFIASLVSIPVLFTIIALVMAVVAQIVWLVCALIGNDRAAGTTVVGAIAGLLVLLPVTVLAFMLCLLVPRAILAWRSTWRISKRRRELLSSGALILALGFAYSFSLLSNAGESLGNTLLRLATTAYQIVLWTPFGAPVSVPIDLAEGHWFSALARLAITLVSVALVWKWWEKSFTAGMLDALREASGDADLKVTALVPRILPSNALGAIVGKALRYWRRDTRYSVALLMLPVMTLFFVAMSVIGEGQSFMGWVAIAMTAWMGGITISNEVGFDGPSSWVNITAGINNRVNLLGRYIALALFIGPWLLFLCILVPILQNSPGMIAITIPASFGFMLSSWGISMLVTAFFPYPAPAPGTMKSSSAGTAWISMLSAFIGTWLPMVPVMILMALGFTLVPGLQYAGALLALVIGAFTLWFGLRTAAKRLDTHYAEAFQATKAFVAA